MTVPSEPGSDACRWMARAAWLVTLVWFEVVLLVSFGWVGPGPAFFLWSLPALPLAVMTWTWWRRLGLVRTHAPVLAAGIAWLLLLVGARVTWYWSLSPVLDATVYVMMVAYPLLLTAVVLWRIGRHSRPQVAA
jgi:hypothetical protein